MKTYDFAGYKLTMKSQNKKDKFGHEKVSYTFSNPAGTTIFDGDDFGASPMHPAEGKESAISLLTFLTLRPGDTDSEYFDKYTPEQLEFANSIDCENLQIYTFDD
jgi:hypothetical protein